MNLWKFDADRISSADIVAFTDDDSCMQDYVLPSEIVTSSGKLVAKGVKIKVSAMGRLKLHRTRLQLHALRSPRASCRSAPRAPHAPEPHAFTCERRSPSPGLFTITSTPTARLASAGTRTT
eukprot:4285889-Prymnesium_polylepis.2